MTKQSHQIYADGQIVNISVTFDKFDFFAAFTDSKGKRLTLRGVKANTPDGLAAWHDAYKRVVAADSRGKECSKYLVAAWTPANLIKSIGLRTEVIAKTLGVAPQTVRAWACGSLKIPPHRLAQLTDLAEAVRQVLAEQGKAVPQSHDRNP